MITRIWHGRTRPDKSESYLQFLLHEGTSEYIRTAGNRSVKIWRNNQKDSTHFWTVTEWPDTKAIKEFAGDEYEKAKYYAEDEGVLLEFEDKVAHYECFDVSNHRIKEYLRQMEELYNGGSWQGESISGKLKSITDVEAFHQPFPGVHSVAEIVWHCIYWRKVCLKRMEGDNLYRDQTMEALNFVPLAELQKKGWDYLLTLLQETQSALTEKLCEKRDAFLEQEYQPGYTFNYLIEGLIHHDIYHLGQIGLVIKINRSIHDEASQNKSG